MQIAKSAISTGDTSLRNDALEEAAKLIEAIVFADCGGEKLARKRPNGDVSNLAYATAIRDLKMNGEAK